MKILKEMTVWYFFFFQEVTSKNKDYNEETRYRMEETKCLKYNDSLSTLETLHR